MAINLAGLLILGLLLFDKFYWSKNRFNSVMAENSSLKTEILSLKNCIDYKIPKATELEAEMNIKVSSLNDVLTKKEADIKLISDQISELWAEKMAYRVVNNQNINQLSDELKKSIFMNNVYKEEVKALNDYISASNDRNKGLGIDILINKYAMVLLYINVAREQHLKDKYIVGVNGLAKGLIGDFDNKTNNGVSRD
ncbi:MAG: hypothetical protein LHV68_05330 [Elusimicrobia bacterium]|nr:hypothetical protein [Candidatus Liberimonas magnetica]